jgi:microcystin-dependent protein
MLGTENETIFIPGKTTIEGDMSISNTMLVKGGATNETTINGSISLAGDVSVSGDLAIGSGANIFTVNSSSTFEYPTKFNSTTTFNQAITFTNTINDVTSTTFNFLKNVSEDIQETIDTINLTINTYLPNFIRFKADILQTEINDLPSSIINTIQNSSLILYNTLNVSGLTTLTETQINTNLTILGNIIFNGTINSLSTFKFVNLTNVRYDIQQQFDNNTPVGSVIAFAGTAAALTGYLPCNGAFYSTTQYPKLYQAIGTIYGSSSGQFAVPNFNGVFLRDSGSQMVNERTYTAPNMGSVSSDSVGQTTSNNEFVNNVSTSSQNFIRNASGLFGINLGQAVTSVNTSKSNDNIGSGTETAPVHMSVQYFIKYLV